MIDKNLKTPRTLAEAGIEETPHDEGHAEWFLGGFALGCVITMVLIALRLIP